MPGSTDNSVPARRGGLSAPLVAAVLAIGALLLAGGYWLAYHGLESTDDANIEGTVVYIAPKVSGYVTAVAVRDNQLVRAGDLLAQVDTREYEAARASAEAQLSLAQAQLASARVNLDIVQATTQANVISAGAALAQAQAGLAKAHADYRRQRLINPRATTQEQVDAARAVLQTAQSQVTDAQAHLATARLAPKTVQVAQAQVTQLEAQLRAAQAALQQAALNLSYTRITAPIDGRVTRKALDRGDFVQPGVQAMALVAPEVWIVANFKESQLRNMKVGQPVSIRVDAFPALHLDGHVDSLQMGTGARFSTFPAENATGNFVKIVQRVPVKIVIDRGLDASTPLPLGLSVVPTVNER